MSLDPKTRSLIETLRDETQSRSVYDRCNEVLAATEASKPRDTRNAWKKYVDEFHGVSTITATEAEVEIITGEKR